MRLLVIQLPSNAGLVGGGRNLQPGEITKSHRGVLFLDELPEFTHTALESLRQPLEDKVVTISRVAGTVTYPASFMLVGAMNPCPCGYNTHPRRQCTCSPSSVARYQKKISGPLLDRIDVFVEVPPVVLETPSDLDSAVFPFTTDIPFLSAWGKPLLLGPGSVLVAHTDQEHVRIAEMVDSVDHYVTLARHLLASG